MDDWTPKDTFNLLLGIALFAASVYISLRLVRKKSPIFRFRSMGIFVEEKMKQIPKLTAKFAGTEVTTLTRTRIVFWNAGKETIDRQSVLKEHPITISAVGDVKILDSDVIRDTGKSKAGCVLNREKTKVTINFSHYEYLEGFALEIYHTGKGDADLELGGAIKGVKTLRRRNLPYGPRIAVEPIEKRIALLAMFVAGLLMSLINRPAEDTTFWIVASFQYFLIAIILVYRYFTIPPKGLRWL